jgi:hypothetical protein
MSNSTGFTGAGVCWRWAGGCSFSSGLSFIRPTGVDAVGAPGATSPIFCNDFRELRHRHVRCGTKRMTGLRPPRSLRTDRANPAADGVRQQWSTPHGRPQPRRDNRRATGLHGHGASGAPGLWRREHQPDVCDPGAGLRIAWEVDFDGVPGPHLEPLDDEARYATLNAGQVSVDPARWSQTHAHSLDQFP